MNTIKKVYIFVLVACFSSLHSMNIESLKRLTPQEADCLTWFEATKTSIKWGIRFLPEEDQNVFKHGTTYRNNMDAITKLLEKFVSGFCQKATAMNVPLKYDEPIIASTLIKIKEFVAARMFVFNELLTKEERLTIQPEHYIKNPQAAYNAMLKAGKLLAEEHAALKLIPDTTEAKEKAAQEFTQNKMIELEVVHGKLTKNNYA